MSSYLVIIALFCVPLAVNFFATEFFASHPATEYVEWAGLTSPFAASFAIPLDMELVPSDDPDAKLGNWQMYGAYVAFTAAEFVPAVDHGLVIQRPLARREVNQLPKSAETSEVLAEAGR